MLEKTYTLATVGNLGSYAILTGLVIAIVLLCISIAVSKAILPEIGKASAAVTKRRTVFWLLAVISPVVTFCIDFFVYRSHIKSKVVVDQFFTYEIISVVAAFVLYVLIGLILAKTVFKDDTKFATVF